MRATSATARCAKGSSTGEYSLTWTVASSTTAAPSALRSTRDTSARKTSATKSVSDTMPGTERE